MKPMRGWPLGSSGGCGWRCPGRPWSVSCWCSRSVRAGRQLGRGSHPQAYPPRGRPYTAGTRRRAPTRGGHSRQEPTSRARPPRPAWSSPHDLVRVAVLLVVRRGQRRPGPAARRRPQGHHLPARRGQRPARRAALHRQGAARERPASQRDGGAASEADVAALAAWRPGAGGRRGDPLHARACAAPGLHRRARRRGPGGHARRHGGAGWRPGPHQPARAGQPGHRPQRPGRSLRQLGGLRLQRGARVRAQRRALPAAALGADGAAGLPRRAARDRHRPPGQPRAPRRGGQPARGGDRWRDGRWRPGGLPGHARGHRFPHHHDQRPGHPGLRRGRHRGGGRAPGPAALPAPAAGRGRAPARSAADRQHGH